MLTPFSGLSLLLHLTVIGIGKFFDVFPHLKLQRVRRPAKRVPTEFPLLARGISVIIVAILSTAMVFSFWVAIKTSARVGADEWHRKYAKEVWILVRDYSGERLARVDTSLFLELISIEEEVILPPNDSIVSNGTVSR